jgi:hypothetical protein
MSYAVIEKFLGQICQVPHPRGKEGSAADFELITAPRNPGVSLTGRKMRRAWMNQLGWGCPKEANAAKEEPYRYGDSNPGFRTENCLCEAICGRSRAPPSS